MCLVYSTHKMSQLQNCIDEVTFHLNACHHYYWHQRCIFTIVMSYGWNRLGTWCRQFLEYLIYMIYYLEWYIKHCGSHKDRLLFCFEGLLSFWRLFHAFICLTHSSHLQSALRTSEKMWRIRQPSGPDYYIITLMIYPLDDL